MDLQTGYSMPKHFFIVYYEVFSMAAALNIEGIKAKGIEKWKKKKVTKTNSHSSYLTFNVLFKGKPKDFKTN